MTVLQRLTPTADWHADLLAPSLDTLLRQAVLSELARTRCAGGSPIDAQADSGVVTLVGVVASHVQRREAAFATLRVPGLQGLLIEIEVDPRLLDRPDPPRDPAPSWLAALADTASQRLPASPPTWWLDRRAQLERSELERLITATLKCWALNLQWVPCEASLPRPGTFQALLGLDTDAAGPVTVVDPSAHLRVMADKAAAGPFPLAAAGQVVPAAAGLLPDQRRACFLLERRGPARVPCPVPDRRATAGARWSAPRYAGGSDNWPGQPGP